MKPTKAHSSQEGQRRPTKRKQGPGVFFLNFFICFTDNHGPKRRRRVVCLGRFIGSASICPPPPPTSLDDSLVASPASIWPHHHQRVLVTRWTVPPASFRPPTTVVAAVIFILYCVLHILHYFCTYHVTI
jgi:hypothetical protein